MESSSWAIWNWKSSNSHYFVVSECYAVWKAQMMFKSIKKITENRARTFSFNYARHPCTVVYFCLKITAQCSKHTRARRSHGSVPFFLSLRNWNRSFSSCLYLMSYLFTCKKFTGSTGGSLINWKLRIRCHFLISARSLAELVDANLQWSLVWSFHRKTKKSPSLSEIDKNKIFQEQDNVAWPFLCKFQQIEILMLLLMRKWFGEGEIQQ